MVLLNFVIALISQYYEDVMNSAEMHNYVMRQELNHEYYVFNEFMVQMALHKDDNIDAFILIDGEAVENECEWKGLTQTMKKEFVKENDKTKREIEKVREEMKLTNDKVDKFKDEVTAQLSQITTLIKKLSQSE